MQKFLSVYKILLVMMVAVSLIATFYRYIIKKDYYVFESEPEESLIDVSYPKI